MSLSWIHALDIGSRKLTLASGIVDRNGQITTLHVETVPSRGIFKGVVNDLTVLSDSIHALFGAMQTRTRQKIVQVAVSVNGNYIRARRSVAAMALAERGTRSISRRDIDRLNAQARLLGLDLDEELLHEFPQGYSIDRHNMTLCPLGLHGRRFEVTMFLVTAPATYVENISKAVARAGADVVNVVFSGVAAAEAVVSETEKKNGVVLVDIGEALTDVLVFKDGVLRRVDVVSFGGKNVSEIIAHYCRIPMDGADEIKELSVDLNDQIPADQEIMVREGEQFRSVSKRDVSSILSPEIEKFTGMIKTIIREDGLAASAGVVVVGGLSLMEGLLERMERDLGRPVNLGISKGIGDISVSKAPSFASAIGLVRYQHQVYRQAGLGFRSSQKNKLAKVVDYVSNLYQDYF